eukprot:scaffold29380_cov70-Phaeocystis_antarctica.AAC.7
MVCGLVWGIGLRRLGCGCGRRLVTGSCVFRETTQTGCPWSWPRVSLSIYLSKGVRSHPIWLKFVFAFDRHMAVDPKLERS